MTLWQVFVINIIGGLLTGFILAYKMDFDFKKINELKMFSNIRTISVLPSMILIMVTTVLYFIPLKIQLNNFSNIYVIGLLVGKFLINALSGFTLGYIIIMAILIIKQIKKKLNKGAKI